LARRLLSLYLIQLRQSDDGPGRCGHLLRLAGEWIFGITPKYLYTTVDAYRRDELSPLGRAAHRGRESCGRCTGGSSSAAWRGATRARRTKRRSLVRHLFVYTVLAVALWQVAFAAATTC